MPHVLPSPLPLPAAPAGLPQAPGLHAQAARRVLQGWGWAVRTSAQLPLPGAVGDCGRNSLFCPVGSSGAGLRVGGWEASTACTVPDRSSGCFVPSVPQFPPTSVVVPLSRAGETSLGETWPRYAGKQRKL